MRKFVSLLLVFAVFFTFAACGETTLTEEESLATAKELAQKADCFWGLLLGEWSTEASENAPRHDFLRSDTWVDTYVLYEDAYIRTMSMEYGIGPHSLADYDMGHWNSVQDIQNDLKSVVNDWETWWNKGSDRFLEVGGRLFCLENQEASVSFIAGWEFSDDKEDKFKEMRVVSRAPEKIVLEMPFSENPDQESVWHQFSLIRKENGTWVLNGWLQN